jgi:hypothetical protein
METNETLKHLATGSHDEFEDVDYKLITYPFGRYEIKIKLTPRNEFIEIVEIKINKDFLSYKQKLSTQEIHEVDEFYPE